MNINFMTSKEEVENNRDALRSFYPSMSINLCDKPEVSYRVSDISSGGIRFVPADLNKNNNFSLLFRKLDRFRFHLLKDNEKVIDNLEAEVMHSDPEHSIIGCRFNFSAGQQRNIDKLLTQWQKDSIIEKKADNYSYGALTFLA